MGTGGGECVISVGWHEGVTRQQGADAQKTDSLVVSSLLHEVAVCLVPSLPLKQGVGRDHDVKGGLS